MSPRIRAAVFVVMATFGLADHGVAGEPARPLTSMPADLADEAPEPESGAPIDFAWLAFPDGEKFAVRGLPWLAENGRSLWRLPASRFDVLPEAVKRRCKAPSGARILIRSNTTKLGLKATPAVKGGGKGFDVYIDGSFYRSAVAEQPGRESSIVLFKDLDRRTRNIVVYLPCHQEITIESVGVDRDAAFRPPALDDARPLPIVFYGSSVCQGSGTSRPGMTYEAIVCRALHLDFVNLGFGGAGKAEKAVVDLVSTLPACCYVFDLGKSYGMQDATAYREMLQTVRRTHPDVPIVCITPITSSIERHNADYARRSEHTRQVVEDAVRMFVDSGEKKVYLVDGRALLGFEEHDGLSKDGVHPSDNGFDMIARKLLPVLKQAIGL